MNENQELSVETIKQHPVYKEKVEEVVALQKDLSEMNDYLNKLEASYNQGLEYISHIENIINDVLF